MVLPHPMILDFVRAQERAPFLCKRSQRSTAGAMRDAILLGLGRWMIPVPRLVWRRLYRIAETRYAL